MILGDALRRLRVESGLSKYALEKRLDRPKSFIGRIESGERKVDFSTLVDIIRLSGGNFAEFMQEVDRQLLEHYRMHGDPLGLTD